MNETNTDALNKLIKGCINGERNSQQALYKMLYGKMLSVCMRYSKDNDEALDIMQEGFIKVFMNMKSYGGLGSFEGWVRKIMVNTAIDNIRKNKHLKLFVNSEYVEKNGADISLGSEENNDNKYSNISKEEIMEAVMQLTPVYKTVFNMHVVDGFSHKEIAQQLGITEGTSKSNLAKAKMKLQKVLTNKQKYFSANGN